MFSGFDLFDKLFIVRVGLIRLPTNQRVSFRLVVPFHLDKRSGEIVSPIQFVGTDRHRLLQAFDAARQFAAQLKGDAFPIGLAPRVAFSPRSFAQLSGNQSPRTAQPRVVLNSVSQSKVVGRQAQPQRRNQRKVLAVYLLLA